jgi:hypothetical protein
MRIRMFHGLVLGVSSLLPGAAVLVTGCEHCCHGCKGSAAHGGMPVASGNPASGGSGMAAAPAGTPVGAPAAGASRTEVQPAAATGVPGSAGNPYGGQ